LWGSLEIGNPPNVLLAIASVVITCSPFVGIPRNWKLTKSTFTCTFLTCSPFVGIPRNWKLAVQKLKYLQENLFVPPLWGSLEIGNQHLPLLVK